MINMISQARLIAVKNPKASAAENDEAAETKTEDFAALFAAPGESPNNFAHKSVETDEKTFDADSVAADQNFPSDSVDELINKNARLKSILASQQADWQNAESLSTNEKIFSNEAKELIKTYLESGAAEVLNDAETIKSPTLSQNDFSENTLVKENDKFSAMPSLFREISNIFQNDESFKSKQPDSSADFIFESEVSGENQNVAQIESSLAENGSALNPNQPAMAEDRKQATAGEDFASPGFDELLSFAPPHRKLAETISPSAQSRAEKFFEQIEPKILQIINLENAANEKKIFKMRLYPAELGTLEIRLEKDASGALRAHFQTENETTRELLNQSFDQLRDALKNSGWLIERLEISCAPFSSTANENREHESRQSETIENRLKTQSVADDSSDGTDDLKSKLSDRLLSVRA